jgi:hypothetical protein
MRGRYKFKSKFWSWIVILFLFSLASQAWSRPSYYAKIKSGFPVDVNGWIKNSSPVLADLDGDGKKEIIVGTDTGYIYVCNSTGTILAQYNTGTPISSSPSVGDINNDGQMEIVVSTGSYGIVDSNGAVYAFDQNLNLLPGWPQYSFDKDKNGYTDGFNSTPALGDLDNDGDLEIVVGGFDMRIHVWHHDGRKMQNWPLFVYDSTGSSPALGDIDNDGSLEIIIGVDAHEQASVGTLDGGYIHVFDRFANEKPGFPKYIDQIVQSSPALGDINNDGYLEIVVGTGIYSGPGNGYEGKGKAVYAFDKDGNQLWKAETGGYMFSSPALGDIDGDGNLDVAIWSQDGNLYAFDGRSGSPLPGWPVKAKDGWGYTYTTQGNSPVLADYDGDGQADVFLGLGWEVIIIKSDGSFITNDGNHDNDPAHPSFYTSYSVGGSPAIGDIDGDNFLDIVIGSAVNDPSQGRIYVWETEKTLSSLPWPMLRQNASHNGVYPKDLIYDSAVVSSNIPPQLATGQYFNAVIKIKNTGTIDWSPDEGISLSIVGSSDPLYPNGNKIALPYQVPPGSTVTFTIKLHAPSTSGYYETKWRMVQEDGIGWFGAQVYKKVKVGTQPSFYVLGSQLGSKGIYEGGLAPPFSSYPDFSNWPAAQALKVSVYDKRGFQMLDSTGAVWTGGNAQLLGSQATQQPPARELGLLQSGIGFYVMDGYGNFYGYDGGIPVSFSPAPPTFSSDIARSFALTKDDKGVYVLDGYGNVYTGGTASPLTPATPTFSSDIAKKIKLTSDGKGYYVLDAYGNVYAGGAAQPIDPPPGAGIPWDQDRARDFELTEDGKGYYLLDKYGNIYAAGTAPPITINLTPTWSSDIARDLELIDSANFSVEIKTGSTQYSLGSPVDTKVSITSGPFQGKVDVYLALVRPDGSYECLTGMNTFSGILNTPYSIVQGWKPVDLSDLTIFNVPVGETAGTYTWYLIFCSAGSNVLDPDNWIIWNSASFSVQ